MNLMLKAFGALLIVLSVASLALALNQTSFFGVDVPAQGPELLSPVDRVDSSQITVVSNGVLIRGLTNVRLVNFADTNSMDPVIDAEATAIEIIPQSASELKVGDIVSYRSGENTIIHRIISIGNDGEWFAVVKGDNNDVPDSAHVRFEQIKGVVVGIVY